MFALYKFELRKINSRKIVWITGCVMLVGLLIWGVASAVPVSYTHLDVYKRQACTHLTCSLVCAAALECGWRCT